jgi:hypothetical protein
VSYIPRGSDNFSNSLTHSLCMSLNSPSTAGLSADARVQRSADIGSPRPTMGLAVTIWAYRSNVVLGIGAAFTLGELRGASREIFFHPLQFLQ